MSASVLIYTTRYCPYCVRAKQLLSSKNVRFKEIAVDNDRSARNQMVKKAGRTSVPQIWVGHHHVGGCDELFALERAGQLDSLLSS